jgi:hypothetical protein
MRGRLSRRAAVQWGLSDIKSISMWSAVGRDGAAYWTGIEHKSPPGGHPWNVIFPSIGSSSRDFHRKRHFDPPHEIPYPNPGLSPRGPLALVNLRRCPSDSPLLPGDNTPQLVEREWMDQAWEVDYQYCCCRRQSWQHTRQMSSWCCRERARRSLYWVLNRLARWTNFSTRRHSD